MKIFLASIVSIIFTTSAFGCEECTPKEHAQNNINAIDFILDTYEYECSEYRIGFDYHVGYLKGQRKAYKDMINKL